MTEFGSEDAILFTPHQCSIKGGEHLLLSFPGGVPTASEEVFVVFQGSQERHEVPTARRCPTSLYATIPAHKQPELVSLTVCRLNSRGERETLHESQFAFTVDSKQLIAALLEQSTRSEAGGIPLQGRDFPQLPSAQALREFDQSLVQALLETQLPKKWSLVGGRPASTSSSSSSSSSSKRDTWEEDPPLPRETLLHFAARHSLNSLAQYLLSLPGAEPAVVLPNEQGLTPLDLSRQSGNDGLSQLLQLFANQVCSNGLPDSAASTPLQSPLHTETSERNCLSVSLVSRKTSLQELQTFREINQEWKSQVKRHKTSSGSVPHDFPTSSSSSSSAHPPHTLTTKTTASASTPLESTASSLHRNHHQPPPITAPTLTSLSPSTSPHHHHHHHHHRPPPHPHTRSSTSPPHSAEYSNDRLAPHNPPSGRGGKRRSLDCGSSATAAADSSEPLLPTTKSDHFLQPLFRFEAKDSSSVAAAAVLRKSPRKSSWSRVVGNCQTRSIGTGLNELDRITAEQLLQESAHALKGELEQGGEGGGGGRGRGRGGGGERRGSTLHLALSCHLSASCPDLNQELDSVSPSLNLSTATSPGLCSSSFSEDEGSHLAAGEVVGVDLAGSLSPQPPPQTLILLLSGSATDPGGSTTSYQSDSGMSRTDTCSSFESQLQQSSSQQATEGGTTTTIDVGGGDAVVQSSSTIVTSSVIPQVITTENGSANQRSSSLDNGLRSAGDGCENEEDAITASVSHHEDNISPQGGLRTELFVDSESLMTTSISAPNLYTLATSSSSEDSSHRGQGGGGEGQNMPQPSNLSTVKVVCPSLNLNSSLKAVEKNILKKSATSVEADSNKTSRKSDDTAKHAPLRRSGGRLRSHRRSLSTSTVEMLSQIREQPDHHAGGAGGSSQADDGGSSPTEHRQSKSVDNIITASGNSVLEQPVLTTDSLREGDLDDRSRASSFRTNETLSSRQESSDEDGDFLSTKETTSQISLDPSSVTNGSGTSLDSTNLQPLPPPTLSSAEPTAEGETVTLLRNKSKRRALKAVPSINRYSADFLSSNVDEVYLDNSDNVSSVYLPFRRHQSTNVPLTAEEEDIDSVPMHQLPGDLSAITTSELPPENPPFRSPNDVKWKSPNGISDSVFDHDAALSDVEVKLPSDDSMSQSFEQDVLTRASPFFKETGSPKTLKKKTFHKSPLFARKQNQSSDNETPSPQRKRRTLTKQDVKPTVNMLRDLTLDRSDHLSDDSDVTVGADIPARPASVSDPARPPSSAVVHRAGSSASDSVVASREEVGYKVSPPASTVGDESPRRPISPATQEECKDCTSLDFTSTSPLLQKKQALYESSTHHPPSPLSFRHAKSPPESFISDDASPLIASASSPHLSSPPPPVESLSQSTADESLQEVSNLKRSESSKSSEGTAHFVIGSGRMKHALSLDETHSGGFTRRGLSPEPAAAFREHPLAELREEAQEDEEIQEQHVTKTSNKKKLVKLFRNSSKYSKNKPKILANIKGGGAAGQGDSSTSLDFTPTSKSRPKSASKARPKISRSTFEDPESGYVFMTAKEYSQEIKRSESMQVNLNHETGSINRTESLSPTASQPDNQSITTLESVENLHVPPSNAVVSLSPPDGPASDSEQDEHKHDEEHLLRSFSTSYPQLELYTAEEVAWDKTVDRRVYKKMNKPERERQAILHEMLQTERHHLRALHVLKLIFQQNLVKYVPTDSLAQMFPELETLIELSDNFIKKMEELKGTSPIISDFSEILLEQFSGDTRQKMFTGFGGFCSEHLHAMEVYKDHLKKKSFGRIMKELHRLKDCQRLTLPDYYTQISQRLAKVLTLMQRLVKKSEALKKDHAPRLRKALEHLETLITDVDQAVEDHKNHTLLLDIQGRLEVNVPKSAKSCNRKEIKGLSLVAQERKLRMLGEAMWMGHGRQQSVHVLLVTDLLVLLTERDQKYHLATLQDLKPPVIRLYDLHVRLNASVKSGVQLLLLEQGNFPEMFRLEFSSKKEAKQWESKLNSTIEECKEKGLKCEYFGSVTEVLEAERDSDPEDQLQQQLSVTSDISTNSNANPSVRRLQRAKDSLDHASRVLSGTLFPFSSSSSSFASSTTMPASSSTSMDSHGTRHTAVPSSRSFLRESPKNRYRAHTIQQRPKTSTFEDISETPSGLEPVATAPVQKAIQKGKAKKLDRSSTFKGGKQKERDKSATVSVAGGHSSEGGTSEGFRVSEVQYIDCITSLKESLEDVIVDAEEKDDQISALRKELDSLKEAALKKDEEIDQMTQMLNNRHHLSPIVVRKTSPRGSPQQQQRRPHSLHVDLSERGEEEGGFLEQSLSRDRPNRQGPASSSSEAGGGGGGGVLMRSSPVLSKPHIHNDSHNDKSVTRVSNHNQLSVEDTGT